MNNYSISFTTVFIPDSKGRGYTGYFAEFPDLTTQGVTKEEVELNLFASLRDVLKFNKEKENFINNISAKETHNFNLIPA